MFTTYVSSMVIIIHFYQPSLSNSQSIFKVSIAISDVIIGIFVLPSIANNLLNEQKKPVRFENITIATKEAFIATPGLSESKGLSIFFGMCFVIAIIVSIFNLLFAAFDRFMSIFRPLTYRCRNTKKFAFRSTILIWIIALATSLLPVVLNPYLIYGSIFDAVNVVGGKSIFVTVFYGVLAFPVPIMWVTILATYLKCHQFLKKSRNIGGSGRKKELQLVQTLLLMVISFTIGFLPMLIVLVIRFTIPSLDYKNPNDFNLNQASELLSAEFFAYICIILNTVSNFFIYNWRNPEFKKAKLEVTSKLINRLHFRWLITRLMALVTINKRSNVPAKPEKVVKFVHHITRRSTI